MLFISSINETNFQCMIYNIYPLIHQEFLPNDNVIVFIFQRTIQRKFDIFLFIDLSLNQPRNIIFIENQKLIIIASQNINALFFVSFNSSTNSTCLNGTTLPNGDPQALFKIKETFLYVTSWSNKCVYSYHYNENKIDLNMIPSTKSMSS